LLIVEIKTEWYETTDAEITVTKPYENYNDIKTRCSAIAERPRCRVRYSFRQK